MSACIGAISMAPGHHHDPLHQYGLLHQGHQHGPLHNRPQRNRLQVQVRASLIVVLTRGGSTARLVAKYRPSIPVLTVAVPVLTTDSLTWTCSGEAPARQCLITRGLLPLLAEGSARATDTDTTDEILQVGVACALLHAVKCRDIMSAL